MYKKSRNTHDAAGDVEELNINFEFCSFSNEYCLFENDARLLNAKI